MSKVWRERLLRLSICGMELGAIYTFLSLLTLKAAGGVLSASVLLMAYLVSLIANRLFFNLRLQPRFSILLNVLVWLVTMQLIIKFQLFPGVSFFDPNFLFAVPLAFAGIPSGIRPEIFILFSSILLWPLGYRLARVRVGFVVSLAEFQTGLFIILITYAINAQINASFLNSPFVALVFVALAIFSMAIAHAEQANSWLAGRHSVFWLSVLILSIGLIVLAGIIAGAFATPAFLDILLTPVRWAWWAFSKFMLFLAERTPMEKVLDPLDWAESGRSAEDPDSIWRIFNYPVWIRDVLRSAISIVWLGFLIVALWSVSSLIYHWLRSHFISRSSAEVESLHGVFWDDLRSLLAYIRRWFTGLFHPDTGERVSREVASVRQIYREVLSWGANKGIRRFPEQTPYEYLNSLSEAVPLASDDLRTITDQYVNTRYGLFAPGSAELAALKATWQRIKRNGYPTR